MAKPRLSLGFLSLVFGSTIALWSTHRTLTRGINEALEIRLSKQHTNQPLSEVSRSVNWAAKLLPYTTCLSQAITCKARLTQFGYDSQFYIGIRKLDSRLDAHAWVEDKDGTLLCPLRDTSPFTIIETDISELRNIKWS